MKTNRWISDKLLKCDRCFRLAPAYYLLSRKTKGLYIQCAHCGTHTSPFVDGLDLPEKPTKDYWKHEMRGLLFEQNVGENLIELSNQSGK